MRWLTLCFGGIPLGHIVVVQATGVLSQKHWLVGFISTGPEPMFITALGMATVPAVSFQPSRIIFADTIKSGRRLQVESVLSLQTQPVALVTVQVLPWVGSGGGLLLKKMLPLRNVPATVGNTSITSICQTPLGFWLLLNALIELSGIKVPVKGALENPMGMVALI